VAVQIKFENVRDVIATQFALFRVFLPGMYSVGGLWIYAMVAVTASNGVYGTTAGLTAIYVFPVVILAAVTAYVAVRVKPQIARKEIVDFIEARRYASSFYKKVLAELAIEQENLHREWHDLITKVWKERCEEDIQKTLATIDLLLGKISEITGNQSSEFRLLNHNLVITAYADARKWEAKRAELEASSATEIPEGLMQQALIDEQRMQHDLQEHIDRVKQVLSIAQASADEAQRLL
jgi:hypothetical protein